MENTKTIEISRVFDRSLETIWNMWTKPEYIMKWWGPENFTAPVIKVDFRVGGKYLYCMRGRAGPNKPVMNFWSGGIFKEIVQGEKIVCLDGFADEDGNIVDPVKYGMPKNFPKESLVTITFENINNKTKVKITYDELSSEEYKAMMDTKMEDGWNSSLDKLAKTMRLIIN